MKRTTISVILLVCSALLISAFALVKPEDGWPGQAATIELTTPVNISQSSSLSENPLVGADGSGAAYAVWFEYQTGWKIFFSTNKSGSWTTPVRIEVILTTAAAFGWPALAVSGSGVCHLAFNDARIDISKIYYLSNNNGWGPTANLSENNGPSVYSGCAVNPTDDIVYIVWQEGVDQNNGGDIDLRYQSPSGARSSIQVVPAGKGFGPKIAIDAAGTAHLVWDTGPRQSLWYSKNRTPQYINGWTQPLLVKSNTGRAQSFPRIDCDNAGNAYIIWVDGSLGNDEIFMRKVSSDGTLADEMNISQTAGSSQEGTIAVDKNNGFIYIAWAEAGNIYLSVYTGSWGPVVDVASNAAPSKTPSLAVDPTGIVHLIYAGSSGGNQEIFYRTISQVPTTSTTTSVSTTTTSTTSTTTSTTSTTTSTTTSIPVKPKPPLDPALDTRLNSSQTQKTNSLTWRGNPENSGLELKEYRIYRKRANMPDSDFAPLASVSTATFQYADEGLALNQKFTYGLTTVPLDAFGLESEMSPIATEIRAFPPLGVACQTVINNSLFRREKINVISWQKNPLNEAVTLVQYNIYRKKFGQDDSAYELVVSVAGSVAEYRDRKLSFNEKYVYVLTAIDTGGTESQRSNPASEES